MVDISYKVWMVCCTVSQDPGDYSLVSCIVVPPFDWTGYEAYAA